MSLRSKIILCVLVVEVVGGLGGFVTAGSIDTWYAGLEKPPGTPPNWLFGPVWVVLYAMIGISFARVWHEPIATSYLSVSPELRTWGPAFSKKGAFVWFAIQLILNLAWTPVFFGAHWMLVALAIMIALLFVIVVTIRKFDPISKQAARLLVPYALWVSYATYLNAGYWWLNS